MSIKHLIIVLFLIMLSTSIQAETINCTPITSLPATITAQGIYCLTGNLTTSQTSGNAITINAQRHHRSQRLEGGRSGRRHRDASLWHLQHCQQRHHQERHRARILLRHQSQLVAGRWCRTYWPIRTLMLVFLSHGLGALVEHNQVVNTGGTTTNLTGMRMASMPVAQAQT